MQKLIKKVLFNLQYINFLKDHSNFYIRYKVTEVCPICTKPINIEKYLFLL